MCVHAQRHLRSLCRAIKLKRSQLSDLSSSIEQRLARRPRRHRYCVRFCGKVASIPCVWLTLSCLVPSSVMSYFLEQEQAKRKPSPSKRRRHSECATQAPPSKRHARRLSVAEPVTSKPLRWNVSSPKRLKRVAGQEQELQVFNRKPLAQLPTQQQRSNSPQSKAQFTEHRRRNAGRKRRAKPEEVTSLKIINSRPAPVMQRSDQDLYERPLSKPAASGCTIM